MPLITQSLEDLQAELAAILDEVIVQPQQKRTEEKLQQMLAEGEKLLIEHGIDGLHVDEVCARSNSNKMSFYNRFGTKENFFIALQVRHVLSIVAMGEDLIAQAMSGGKTLGERIFMVTRLIFATQNINPKLNRAFMRYSSENPMPDRVMIIANLIFKIQIIKLLKPHMHEINHPDPETAIMIAMDIPLNMVLQSHIHDSGPLHLHTPGLDVQIADAMMRVLTGVPAN